MKKTFFAVVLAGMCAVGANAAVTPTAEDNFTKVNGCYQIGSFADLLGFAKNVVGTTDNSGNKNACGQVIASIDASSSDWTPIKGFTGYFDGNGNEITGLKTSLSFIQGITSSSDNVGFFGTVSGGAVIKNLKLTSVDINSEHYVGGLIGSVVDGSNQSKTVLIDNCGVSGSVNGNKNVGGLVGNVSSGMTLIIANSYNNATVAKEKYGIINVSGLGGLVGYVDGNLTLVNDYNTGSATTNPLVGDRAKSASVTAIDVGCSTDSKCTSVVGSNGVTQGAAADLTTAYSDSLSNPNYQSTKVKPLYDASAVAKMLVVNPSYISVTGVTFSNTKNGVTATLSDAAGELSIPQDINVDSVVLNRVFDTELSSSTVMLPFEIAASKVENAEFFNITGVTKTGGTAETEAATISAYKPYLVKPMQSSIGFKGAVTLKQTTASEETSYLVGEWSFRGRITNKIWREADVDGKAYTYSPKALSNGIAKGEFAKIGKNVRVKTMRAYLYYSGSSATPLAKARTGATLMSTEEIAVEDLPATIPMTFIHKEIVVKDDNEVASTEGEDKGTLSVAKPVKATTIMKSNRWYDLKGRSLNGKPQNHGAFINNKTSVIVK